MSWNEIKVSLAPAGSVIAVEEDPAARTPDGSPVRVIEIRPPQKGSSAHVEREAFHEWLTRRGFHLTRAEPRFTEYVRDEISILLELSGETVVSAILNFVVNLDAKVRLQHWNEFVRQVCRTYGFEIVHPAGALIQSDRFIELAQNSFAWECLLKRET